MPRTEKVLLHWKEFLLGLSWLMVCSHWQVRFSTPLSAAGGWEIWFRKGFACADINGQGPQKDLGYLGYHCCLCLSFSKNFSSASLCPGAFTALAVWTGSTCYLYCFFLAYGPLIINSFCFQKNISTPKNMFRQWGRAQVLVFLLVSGPSCSFRDSDPIDCRGEIKKYSETSWASHLVSLLATFSFSNAMVIFMQGDGVKEQMLLLFPPCYHPTPSDAPCNRSIVQLPFL